jgi:hypothetical protein
MPARVMPANGAATKADTSMTRLAPGEVTISAVDHFSR